MSDQQNPNNPSAKLSELLKFDPGKRHPVSTELFAEALKEITEEREESTKKVVKELLSKGMDLRQQMVTAEKQFNTAKRKFDKELGKIIKQVQGMLNGQEATDDADKDKDEAETANA